MNKITNKKDYEVPFIMVLEMAQQRVVCASGTPNYNGFGPEEDM